MAFCINCGNELKDSAKFCSSCGAKQQTSETEETNNGTTVTIPKVNVNTAELKKEASAYWQFAKKQLIRPTIEDSNASKKTAIITSILLLSAFYLNVFATLNKAIREFSRGYSIRWSDIAEEIPIGAIFFKTLIAIIIVYAAFILLSWAENKYINLTNDTPLKTYINFTNLQIPVLVVVLANTLLTILGIMPSNYSTFIYTLTVIVSMTFVPLAIVFKQHSSKARLAGLYLLIVHNALVVGIIHFFTKYLTSIVEDISNTLYWW